jgi:hypothetical protein
MFVMRLVPEVLEADVPTQAHWVPATLDNTVVYSGYDEQVFGFVDDVAYQQSFPPLAPSQFTAACSAGYRCTSATAATADNPDCPNPEANGAACNYGTQHGCVMIDGYDRRHGEEGCNQLVGIVDVQPPFKQGTQRLRAGFVLEVGSADDVSVYTGDPYGPVALPLDDTGWAWKSHDGSTGNWTWHGDNNSFSSVRYDYYWCDGDENQFFRDPDYRIPLHYHWYEGAEAKFDVYAHLEPALGFKNNLAVRPAPGGGWQQYLETYTDNFATGDQLNPCVGWYDQDDLANDGFRHLHRRYPLGRGWNIYMDSVWGNSRSGDKGKATITWAHVWKKFSYQFKVSVGPGFGCGPGGTRGVQCGPDFIGFSLEPYEEDKSVQDFYAVNWCYGRSDC